MVMMPTNLTPPPVEIVPDKVTLVDMGGGEVQAGGFPPDHFLQVEHLEVVDHLVEKVGLGHPGPVVFHMVPQDWMFYWVAQEAVLATWAKPELVVVHLNLMLPERSSLKKE